MNLELRKISHSKTLSEETPAYTADLYVDGKLFAHVSNHGHGGCDSVHPPKGTAFNDAKFNEALAALESHIKTTFPKETYMAGSEEHSLDMSLELWCHVELGKVELQKVIKRDLAKKIMFVKPADGKLYAIKVLDPARLGQMIAAVKERHGIAQVINEMPMAEAVKAYESAGA